MSRPDEGGLLTGDLETAYGVPVTSSWGTRGGAGRRARTRQATKFQAETIKADRRGGVQGG